MLKKLKLTLLMSGVIFLPKGTYAADHDKDEKLKTIASKLTSSSQRQAQRQDLSLFPAFARNVSADPSAGPSSSKPASSSQQADAFLPYVSGRPSSSSPSSRRQNNSLMPVFAYEPVDAQLSAGPSSSQVDIGSSSFEVDFNPYLFHGGLTTKGYIVYSNILQSDTVEVDVRKYFNFNGFLQGPAEAEKTISAIMQLLRIEAEKPLKDIEEKQKEIIRLFSSLDDQNKKKFNLSVQNELVALDQQAKVASDFFGKLETVEDFTEATLVNLLKEIPENSRNLIERMARPFFLIKNLEKSLEKAFSSEK